MTSLQTCAVVQGNIRYGTDQVLACLARQFDNVILSTWDDESPERIPRGDWEIVLSRKPSATGYTHRNYQRLGSAAGLRRAVELGATHVLKWRTDMLPTRLDVAQLLLWSNERVPPGLPSRLVTCAFRNLTVKQDWFSTIPDLFAFADISVMQLLWGDDGFDYTRNMNVPDEMVEETELDWMAQSDVASGLYCAEAELYALFKSRLQRHWGTRFTHIQIAKQVMRLVDHRRLGICWFGAPGQFRSISQALQHPWWTEAIWERGRPRIVDWGYSESGLLAKWRRKYVTPRVVRNELELQADWLRAYLAKFILL